MGMFQVSKYARSFQAVWRRSTVALASCLLFSAAAAAQGAPSTTLRPEMPLPSTAALPLRVTFPPLPVVKVNDAVPAAGGFGVNLNNGALSSVPTSGNAPADVRRITLDEAQQIAGGANNPLVRLAQLQVQVAKEHRLGVQSMYFPNIGGQLENLHFNKNTGPVLTLDRLGRTVPVDIIGKNQTAFNFSAIQPITPLFAVHQLVKIARADENIARAKAGMPVAETASKVEKNYFDLLIAERELVSAEADSKKIRMKWLSASSSGAPSVSIEQEADTMGAEKDV